MKMFAVRFTIALIALCAFCFGVFAEEKAQVQYEQGRAAVAYTRTKSRSRVVQPVVVENVQKEAPKAAAQPTVTKTVTKSETCTSGSCATSQVANTETYQYKRGSPFRRSSGGGLFSRSRGSCSSGSCGG